MVSRMAKRSTFRRRFVGPQRLESRRLYASDVATAVCLPIGVELSPQSTTAPEGYTPQQIRHAYGLDSASVGGSNLDGAGQTIAVVDAFDDPNIAGDLRKFDLAFGLPDPPSFQKTELVAGGVGIASNANWADEISLDVEWAHALAPGANILLVEAADAAGPDLFSAAQWAARQAGVSVVSMSFGNSDQSGELSFDGDFTTPAGHQGVTFLAAAGDRGDSSYPSFSNFGLYPALSPNVVGVGATELTTDATGNYLSEVATQYSGGGISRYEPQPAYQQQAGLNFPSRASPDVAFVGGDDSGPGVPIYDSFTFGAGTPWQGELGTSASTVSFAATMATADEGRALLAEGSLDGATQTLPLLYANPGAFHDITQGGNRAFQAGPGYDLVTGLGTPIANLLVPDLVNRVIAVTPLSTQGGLTIAATVGAPVENQQLATFTDPNGALPSADYAATIDWGDGSSSTAVVTPDAAGGLFSVFGSHVYAAVGSFTIDVSIAREGLAAVTVADGAQVTTMPTTPTPGAMTSATGDYVTAAFHDVYARLPTPAELAYWEAQLDDGLAPAVFAADLVGSYENYANEVVTPAYVKFLGREPDAGGLAYWAGQLQVGNLTDEGLAAELVASDEYFMRAGGTNQLWVDALYQDLLGRQADSLGESYWVGQLNAAASRADVAGGFANAGERLQQQIGDDYLHALGRVPDPGGLDYWMAQFAQGATDEDLIAGLIGSAEYYDEHAI